MQALLTPDEVAALLSVSQRKVYALKDTIGYVALGANVRFEHEAVLAYIEQCKRSPKDRGDREWESRHDTAPAEGGGSSRKRVTASDINARLTQRGRPSSTPPSAAQN